MAMSTAMAAGTATTTLVGQSLGKKRVDLGKTYVTATQKITMITTVVISIVLFFFGSHLTALYSKDSLIINLAADMLKIIAIFNPIFNARFIYVSALRGAGDAKFLAVVSFCGLLVVRPVFGMILVNVFHLGLSGIWYALSSDFVISLVITWFRYKRDKWTQLTI